MQFFGIDPDDFATSPNSSADGRRTAGWNLQFVRTHPDEIVIHPNSQLQFDRTTLICFFRTRFANSSASELVRKSLKFVRIRSLTVDGRGGVCIFAWHSSGRNWIEFVRTCPDQFEFRPNSTGRVCKFSDFESDVRTSLQFFRN